MDAATLAAARSYADTLFAGASASLWHTDSGAPDPGLGDPGDFYLDSDGGDFYEKTGASAWTLRGNIKGATGDPGDDGRTILNGSGAPASGLGDEGDFYIDPVAAEIYGPKAAGEWGAGISLVGPEGPAGGDSHVPDPTLETDGRSLEVLTGALVYTTQASKVGHSHTLADVTDSGTAAALDVSAEGDAASDEVVKGDDSRLADDRDPTAHTHTLTDITDSGGAAALDVGTTTGTVAAGDDPRIVNAVQPGDALDINAQTGTAYTLVLGDAGKLVTLDNGAGITLTVPTNEDAAFPVGSVIALQQLGAGAVDVVGATGVTINGVAPGSEALTDEQYLTTAALTKHAADVWTLTGAAEQGS